MSVLNVNAAVESKYDVLEKLNLVNELARNDFSSFVNKSELIGYRLNSFEMSTHYYVNNVYATADKLTGFVNQIKIIESSSEMSDTQKLMQYNKIYRDTEAALTDLDANTINYLMNLKWQMPSISYLNYSKKMLDYYNSLNLTDNQLTINKW